MRLNLLRDLRDFIRDVPEQEVWMNCVEKDCGAAYCGMGWAPMVPSIREFGLRRRRDDFYFTFETDEPEFGYTSAAMTTFDITEEQADLLFGSLGGFIGNPNRYDAAACIYPGEDKRALLNRLDSFLEENE